MPFISYSVTTLMPRQHPGSDRALVPRRQVSDSPLPVPRAEHGALVDPTAQVAYVVGGHDDRGNILSTCVVFRASSASCRLRRVSIRV